MTETADDQDPAQGPTGSGLGQLLDLLVYAPIGVLSKLTHDLPDLVATGKQRVDGQLTMARFLGQMAVRQVTSELDRRLDAKGRARHASTAASGAATDALVAEPSSVPASLPEAIIDAVEHEIEDGAGVDDVPSGAVSAAHVVSADELPIDGYDSLAASQVVLRLGSLTSTELATIQTYESAHRGRRTILGKIHQLQAG